MRAPFPFVAGIALVALLVLAGPAAANLYQCKNSDGSVRYQQTPCGVGMQGTRLDARSHDDSPVLSTRPKTTWGEVRRAKSQCDEVARHRYASDEGRRQRERASCMERVDRACDKDRDSRRCRREIRNIASRAESARTPRKRAGRAQAGDPELLQAKARCHTWSSAGPSYRTRQTRAHACQALAGACRADRHGPECRERIRQLRLR